MQASESEHLKFLNLFVQQLLFGKPCLQFCVAWENIFVLRTLKSQYSGEGRERRENNCVMLDDGKFYGEKKARLSRW